MTASVETLEASYEKFADAYGAALERGDHRTANRNHDKLRALVPRLRAHGDQGQAALVRLMRSQSDGVAAWAATHCLPFAEAKALEVLDNIGRKAGLNAFDAMMTARLWRAGELTIR